MKITLTFNEESIHLGRIISWLMRALIECPYRPTVTTDLEEVTNPLLSPHPH